MHSVAAPLMRPPRPIEIAITGSVTASASK
jgi:hypothetical protein